MTRRDAAAADDMPHAAVESSLPDSGTHSSRLYRKLETLRRVGLFGTNTEGATITRAQTLDDLRQAYQLVHQVYIQTGFIEPEYSGIRLRMFEAKHDTATFVAKVGDRVVGVLSIVPDSSDLGLPSDAAFKEELDVIRKTGRRLCEVTNQVVIPEYRKSAVSTELMRCALAHAANAGYDEGIAIVSPSHKGFYDLLRYREIGSLRSYSDKLHDPVIALCCDVTQYQRPPVDHDPAWLFVHHFMTAGNHFLQDVQGWSEAARRHFFSYQLLRQLFVVETRFVDRCSSAELRTLKRLWGYWRFAAVAGRTFSTVIQEAMTTGICWVDTLFLHWSLRAGGYYPRFYKGAES